MTEEFGKQEEDASLLSHATGISIRLVVPFVNLIASDERYRYNITKARLYVGGESEDSRDAYERGRLAQNTIDLALFVPIFAMFVLAIVGSLTVAVVGDVVAPVFQGLATATLGLSLFSTIGTYTLGKELSVVDHTTEPAPDAVEAVKRRYENGEIDEQELEREAAEAWER